MHATPLALDGKNTTHISPRHTHTHTLLHHTVTISRQQRHMSAEAGPTLIHLRSWHMGYRVTTLIPQMTNKTELINAAAVLLDTVNKGKTFK